MCKETLKQSQENNILKVASYKFPKAQEYVGGNLSLYTGELDTVLTDINNVNKLKK